MNRRKSNVIQFPKQASRAMALRWVVDHHTGFPDLASFVLGPVEYGNWKFYLLDGGETVFWDGASPCITADDYHAALQEISREMTRLHGA